MSFLKAGIWGLKVESGKEYSQRVDSSFGVSMAALSHTLPKNGARTSITVTTEGREFVLCSLTPGKIEQQVLDLSFLEGEEITFKSIGNCNIDLTGNYLVLTGDEDEEYTSGEGCTSLSMQQETLSLTLDSLTDDSEEGMWMEGSEEDSEEDSEDEELDEMEIEAALNGKRKMLSSPVSNAKKAKIVELEEEEVPKKAAEKPKTPTKTEAKKDAATPASKKEIAAAKKAETAASAKKAETPASAKKAETPASARKETPVKADSKAATPVSAKAVAKQTPAKEEPKAAAKKAEAAPTPKSTKKTLPSGLVIEDVLEGKGTKAKNGKKVGVRYIGRLMNGKVFDSNTKGAPFKFRLGAGEVIKGWDLGVSGMSVGGTRRLTIPASLAYGPRGAPPDIPGNATLDFEVKLMEVK
ncbi:hypothetical protein PhCBS80983_g01572 [Powellomyces hirtus]|uniref:FK506-binding protein n=1 Tax=Powellomyces hirtus TaxID=109895 RepID=A0A507ECD1_9FUNG|nr:hypothetical protein PhCBS80983_g01572 [Powellomyces hirtus]